MHILIICDYNCVYIKYVPELWTEWGQKEFPLSKNPEFNYSAFCLVGFKKTFPILLESEPIACANWLYQIASSFSGRDGRSLAGGGENDILCAISAAAAVEIEVCAAREIKNSLRAKLRQAWLNNDHAAIFYSARSFERAASMAIVDIRDVKWADPYRTIERDEEEDVIMLPKDIEEWVETLCEPSQARSIIGNRSRNRLRRKPVKLAVKSLFEENL